MNDPDPRPATIGAVYAEARDDLARLLAAAVKPVTEYGREHGAVILTQAILDQPSYQRLELASITGAALADLIECRRATFDEIAAGLDAFAVSNPRNDAAATAAQVVRRMLRANPSGPPPPLRRPQPQPDPPRNPLP